MNSIVLNARCDVVAVANAAFWLSQHGAGEALTSLSTVVRSVVELFNEHLRAQGLARVNSAEEALRLLRSLGLEVKQTQRGRVQLIKQLAREAEELDGFGDEFGVNSVSDEQVTSVTGLTSERLAEVRAEVAKRLEQDVRKQVEVKEKETGDDSRS